MSKFQVGDKVMVPGFSLPRRVLEVWRRGKKVRYLLGLPLQDGFTYQEVTGIYKVDQLVDEDKLSPAS